MKNLQQSLKNRNKMGKHTCMYINKQNNEMEIIYILLIKFKCSIFKNHSHQT